MFHKPMAVLLCLLVLFLPACQNPFLTPEQRNAAISETEARRDAGELTAAQAAAIIAALKSDEILSELYADRTSIDWNDLLWSIGTIAGSIFGIRVIRGAPRKPEENVALRKMASSQT